LVLPVVPTIFDMGRTLVVPKPTYDFTLDGKGFVYRNGTYIGTVVTHGSESYRYSDTMDVVFSDGTRFVARNGELWRIDPLGPVEVTLPMYDWEPRLPLPMWRKVDPMSVYPEWRDGKLTEVHSVIRVPERTL